MRKGRKTTTFLKQKSYVIAAVLMLVAAFGMTGVYVSEQISEKKQQELAAKQKEEERLAAEKKAEEELAAVDQVIRPENTDFLDEPDAVASKEGEGENQDSEAQDTEEAQETETEEQEEAKETAASSEKELHFDATTDLNWPLQGNVILNYSMDQTVYFATLDQYKYNPAIIIQGNVNDKVQCVADGQISNIETNEVTGCTVTVDLGDGYCAVYGQLKEVPYHAGDYVEAGSIIGYISEPTKYYSVEGSNLYFQLLKDNESIDPMEFLQ